MSASASSAAAAASAGGPPQPSGRRRALPTTPDDKMTEGERLKDEGNGFFKEGLHKKARSRYNRVFAYTRGLGAAPDGGANCTFPEALTELTPEQVELNRNCKF